MMLFKQIWSWDKNCLTSATFTATVDSYQKSQFQLNVIEISYLN